MSTINTKASSLITEYQKNAAPFAQPILEKLRAIIRNADSSIQEDWKWNIPNFHQNGMLCAMASFKKHVSFTFFKGAAINDTFQLFTGDCSAKTMRTIKFTELNQINVAPLKNYINQAVLINNTSSKSPTSREAFNIPKLLKEALSKNSIAKHNYENLAYTYRKEYALHISTAKREATQLRRLNKVMLYLENNLKMHEKL